MPGSHNNQKMHIAPNSAKKNKSEMDLDEAITGGRRSGDYSLPALPPRDRKRRASQIEGDSGQRDPVPKKLRVDKREEEDEDNDDDEDNKEDGNGEDDEDTGLADPSEFVSEPFPKLSQHRHRRGHPSVDRENLANGDSESHEGRMFKATAMTPQHLTELVAEYVAHNLQKHGGRFQPIVVEFKEPTIAELRKLNEKHNIKEGTHAGRMKALRDAADAEAADAEAADAEAAQAAAEPRGSKFCLCM